MEEVLQRVRRERVRIGMQLQHAEDLQLEAQHVFGGNWDPAWNRVLVERLMDFDESALNVLVGLNPGLQDHKQAVEASRRELEETCRGFEVTLERVPLKALAVPGKRPKCPFCSGGVHQSFLAHVRCCPALCEFPDDEEEKDGSSEAPLPSLVDLCVTAIQDHILMLFDGHSKLSKEQVLRKLAWQINPDRVTGKVVATMPPNIVHRLVNSLLRACTQIMYQLQKDLLKIKTTTRKRLEFLHDIRLHAKAMSESAGPLDELFSGLQLFYHQKPVQLQVDVSREENDAKIAKTECTGAERQLNALQQQVALKESKMRKLSMEKDAISCALKAAKEREMQAARLASQSRRGNRARHPPASNVKAQRCSLQGDDFKTKQPDAVHAKPRTEFPSIRARPSSATSKIPLPSTLSPKYRSMIESDTPAPNGV